MDVTCPACEKTISAAPALAGRVVACPRCKAKFEVVKDGVGIPVGEKKGAARPKRVVARRGAGARDDDDDDWDDEDDDDDDDDRGRRGRRRGPGRRRKEVRWIEKGVLMVPRGAELPDDGCMICGGHDGLAGRYKKFQYTPSWIYITILISLLITIILAAILRKNATMDVPLCDRCQKRWTMGTVLVWSWGLGGLFLIPGIFAGIGSVLSRDGGPLGMILGFFVWLIGLFVVSTFLVAKWQIKCKLIDDAGNVTLNVPQGATPMKKEVGDVFD